MLGDLVRRTSLSKMYFLVTCVCTRIEYVGVQQPTDHTQPLVSYFSVIHIKQKDAN